MFGLFRKGFSFIEILIVIAVASILIIALTILIGRAFQLPREYSEQFRITEDIRVQLTRLAMAIRNSQEVTCSDGTIKARIINPLPYDMTLVSNNNQMVRYYIDPEAPNELKRSAADLELTDLCGAGGTPTTLTLMRTLRNYERQLPIFSYFDSEGLPTSDPKAIVRVDLRLVVDVSSQQYPGAGQAETSVSLRGKACANGQCDVSGDAACSFNQYVDPLIKEYAYNLDDFADDARASCQSYCGDSTPGQCCPWDIGYYWDGAADGTVYSVCQCSVGWHEGIPSNLPSSPTTTPIAPGDSYFTEFYRQCWNGACKNSDNQIVAGTVHCDLACLVTSPSPQPHQCVCACPPLEPY